MPTDDRLPRMVSAGMRTLALATHLGFVFVGRINGDEGAYLQIARLVARGELPYREFAFTQMPLLPYIHALPQAVFGPSLLVGRLTSAVFGVTVILLGVDAARRLGGQRAAAIAATFFATFTLGAYMTAIVKTHAVAAFFLVAAVWILTTSLPVFVRLPLASAFGALAAATRFSCIAFAIGVFIIGVRDRRSRQATILLSLAIGTCALALLATDVEAARWGLTEFHFAQWTTTGTDRFAEILTERVPRIIGILGPLAALLFATRRQGHDGRTTTLVRVLGLATIAYVALHLVTGRWHDEYLVPAVAVFIPLVATAASLPTVGWERFAVLFVAATMVLQGLRFVDVDGGLPLSRTGEVAELVAERSEPGDTVFALSALWVVVDADREAVPRSQLLNTGVTAKSPERAEELLLLTPQRVVDVLSSADVPVVVLTPTDRFAIWRTGGDDVLRALDVALRDHYVVAGEFEGVGQTDAITTVYVLSP